MTNRSTVPVDIYKINVILAFVVNLEEEKMNDSERLMIPVDEGQKQHELFYENRKQEMVGFRKKEVPVSCGVCKCVTCDGTGKVVNNQMIPVSSTLDECFWHQGKGACPDCFNGYRHYNCDSCGS